MALFRWDRNLEQMIAAITVIPGGASRGFTLKPELSGPEFELTQSRAIAPCGTLQ